MIQFQSKNNGGEGESRKTVECSASTAQGRIPVNHRKTCEKWLFLQFVLFLWSLRRFWTHFHSSSAILCGVTTEGEVEVLEGESLTVPCFYEPQYASYVKYWCRGRMREFCTSLTRTDNPRSGEAKLNITDDKVQQLFTVTIKELKEEDSGWYMCGVEIGGAWNRDAAAFTYIKVIHGEYCEPI